MRPSELLASGISRGLERRDRRQEMIQQAAREMQNRQAWFEHQIKQQDKGIEARKAEFDVTSKVNTAERKEDVDFRDRELQYRIDKANKDRALKILDLKLGGYQGEIKIIDEKNEKLGEITNPFSMPFVMNQLNMNNARKTLIQQRLDNVMADFESRMQNQGVGAPQVTKDAADSALGGSKKTEPPDTPEAKRAKAIEILKADDPNQEITDFKIQWIIDNKLNKSK